MLNKIVRSVNKYNLDNNLPDDTPELVSILRNHFVDEAINEMIDSNQFIIVESKYFIKYETGTFTKFAELLGSSSRVQWHSPYVVDLQRDEGLTLSEMADIITDLIIRNDLLTTHIYSMGSICSPCFLYAFLGIHYLNELSEFRS